MFVDAVDSPYLVVALDTAGRLDQGLATVAGCLNDVADVLSRDARTAFLPGAIEMVLATARLLRADVLDAIGTSAEAPIEIDERAVLARIRVVMRALRVLRRCESAVPRAALVGRFGSVRDVSTFLVDQIAQIYARWIEQRGDIEVRESATRSALAYAAADDAEIGFALLGRDASLTTFLRTGAASDVEAVRAACREIAATLGLTLAPRGDERTNGTPVSRAERAS